MLLLLLLGVGYTLIPQGLPSGQFNLVKRGLTYIDQALSDVVIDNRLAEVPTKLWGSYSGIDIHPSLVSIYSAVDYAGNEAHQWPMSNAVVNIAQYV